MAADEHARCTCVPGIGCDAEGEPGCVVCQTIDPEWPCPAEHLLDALAAVVLETEANTFGKPRYDMTLDHLHDVAEAALTAYSGSRREATDGR